MSGRGCGCHADTDQKNGRGIPFSSSAAKWQAEPNGCDRQNLTLWFPRAQQINNYDYPKEQKQSADILNLNIQDPAFITFKVKNFSMTKQDVIHCTSQRLWSILLGS
jgi:hypothetical protein